MSEVDAQQRTLAGEHAAVYVYGVLGGQVSRSAQPALAEDLTDAYRTHLARRDQLVRRLRDADVVPVGADPAYALPSPVDTPVRITSAARITEQRCATTYADHVARTSGRDRRWAVNALTDAAIRQLRFQGSPEIFPGAEELADR